MCNIVYLAIVATCISTCIAVPYNTTDGSCDHNNNKADLLSIDITGCESGADCVIHKNTTKTLTIKYKANQDTESVKFHIIQWYLCPPYGVCSIDFGVLLPDVDYNGCHFQGCPVRKGQIQTLTTPLKLPDRFDGSINLRFQIRQKDVMKGDLICANVKVIAA